MKCPQCKEIVNNNRFCTRCGQPILIKLPYKLYSPRPILFEEALDYYTFGKYSESEKILLDLVIKRPEEAEYHNLLGCIYLKQQKYNLAILHLEKAIELSPHCWPQYYNLGIIYSMQKKYQLAKIYFRKTLQIKEDHYQSLYNLGTIFLKEGQYEKAVKAFLKVRDLAPYHINSHVNLKLAVKKLNNQWRDNL